MRLAIDAEIRAIGIDDRNAVEVHLPRVLEEADGQHDTQLTRERTGSDERRDSPRAMCVFTSRSIQK